MHNGTAKKEKSSLLLFVPMTLGAVYVLYVILGTAYRHGMMEGKFEQTYYVPEKPKGEAQEVFDHRKLIKPSADLIALGSKLYSANCASCHGDEGLGNGAAGSKLAVKPRNFVEGAASDWKNGSSPITMYHTLEKGLGGMPNFPALNPKQKYAVIHYVHDSYMKKQGWAEDKEADIAALPAPGGAVEIKIDSYTETRVPVRYAMQKIAQPLPVVKAADTKPSRTRNILGKTLYEKNCLACHGAHGEGTAPKKVQSPLQLKELAWGASLLKQEAPWAKDAEQFRTIVTKGAPGGIKPAFATLSEDELKALNGYVLSLR